MSSWFVDKLGPVPNAVTGKGSLSAPPTRVEDRPPAQSQAQRSAAPQAKAAPAAKAAPPPEPEKKKKKGWF